MLRYFYEKTEKSNAHLFEHTAIWIDSPRLTVDLKAGDSGFIERTNAHSPLAVYRLDPEGRTDRPP